MRAYFGTSPSASHLGRMPLVGQLDRPRGLVQPVVVGAVDAALKTDRRQRLTDHLVDRGGRKGQQARGDDGRHPIVADVIGRRRNTRQAGEHARKRLVSFPLLHFSPVFLPARAAVVLPSFSASACLGSRRPPLTTASRSRSPRFDLSSTSSAPTSSASQRGMVSP